MMMRRLVVVGIAGMALSANACDRKAPEPPAAATVTAPAATEPPTTPVAPVVAEAAGAAQKAADPHAGCADHAAVKDEAAAKTAEGAADCPFHDEKGVPKDAAGCAHGAAGAAKTADAAPAAKVHMGDAFTIETEKALGEVLATATDGESAVRVTGTIEKVCQKKGCWMVVRDGGLEARVIMKDYGFVVPLDSAGKKTSVEGVLKVKVFTEAQARHLADDGGEDPNTVKGEKKEFLLTASAIDIGG